MSEKYLEITNENKDTKLADLVQSYNILSTVHG